MTPEKLLRLQGLLIEDICRTAGFLVNAEPFYPLPPPMERRGSFLHRNLANRRLQLECVNDLMQGRNPRHEMPIDWRSSKIQSTDFTRGDDK